MREISLEGNDALVAASVADSFLTRGRGLLGRALPGPGHGLLLRRCSSVHTCFMPGPLDVVGLRRLDDAEMEVTWLSRDVPPWRLRFARNHTQDILELRAGEIARMGLAAGDRLRVVTPS